MDRRSFIRNLALIAGTLALDPEELLWKPTKKIFIPPAPAIKSPIYILESSACGTKHFYIRIAHRVLLAKAYETSDWAGFKDAPYFDPEIGRVDFKKPISEVAEDLRMWRYRS